MIVVNEFPYCIERLDWDSKIFEKEVFLLVFNKNIDSEAWKLINTELKNADLVYIKNKTKFRSNSFVISNCTDATLYDTNISFGLSKNYINTDLDNFDNILISDNPTFNLEKLLVYSQSRFVNDERLFAIGGKNVYKSWILNAKKTKNKKFLIYIENELPIGFILYAVKKNKYVVELISTSIQCRGTGVGKRLMALLINLASEKNISQIEVGTQISNIKAINFYIRNKFIVDETTDVYHWWKKN